MIEYRTGDLLKQTDLDYLCHVANCQVTMGSGVAAAIRAKWPQVYVADQKTQIGDAKKLGTFTVAPVYLDNGRAVTVLNLYAQFRYGPDDRHLNYEALYRCLEGMKKMVALNGCPIVIGMPYKMGCDRAGGSIEVVDAMLKVLFDNEPLIKLVIVKLP